MANEIRNPDISDSSLGALPKSQHASPQPHTGKNRKTQICASSSSLGSSLPGPYSSSALFSAPDTNRSTRTQTPIGTAGRDLRNPGREDPHPDTATRPTFRAPNQRMELPARLCIGRVHTARRLHFCVPDGKSQTRERKQPLSISGKPTMLQDLHLPRQEEGLFQRPETSPKLLRSVCPKIMGLSQRDSGSRSLTPRSCIPASTRWRKQKNRNLRLLLQPRLLPPGALLLRSGPEQDTNRNTRAQTPTGTT